MTSASAAIAIIPARGGSKGIPRKNLRVIGDKPLIAHAIECARRARGIARTIVSTDDAEIAAVAQRCGADVVWRPAELASDSASSESALLHACQELERTSRLPELLVMLQCTSPLTRAEDVDGAIDLLLARGADCAVAVTPFHGFAWTADETGCGRGINHDAATRLRRQDRAPQFLETGALYVMRTEGFQRAKRRFFGRIVLYEMPRERAWEIDEPADQGQPG